MDIRNIILYINIVLCQNIDLKNEKKTFPSKNKRNKLPGKCVGIIFQHYMTYPF